MAAGGDPVVALSAAGAVHRSELEGWRSAGAVPGSGVTPRDEVEEMLLTRILAEEAERLGLVGGQEARARLDEAERGIVAVARDMVRQRVQPTEEEVRMRYDARRPEWSLPAARRVQTVRLELSTAAGARERREARERLEALGAASAADLSVGRMTAGAGEGEGITVSPVAWVPMDRVEVTLRPTVEELDAGQWAVVESTGGLLLVRCLAVRAARVASYAEVRPRLVGELRQEGWSVEMERLAALLGRPPPSADRRGELLAEGLSAGVFGDELRSALIWGRRRAAAEIALEARLVAQREAGKEATTEGVRRSAAERLELRLVSGDEGRPTVPEVPPGVEH